MGNNLWHFGSSLAFTKTKGFAEIISDELGLKYNYMAESGSSNEQIFQKILDNLHKLKSGDTIITNFTYFNRYSTLNSNGEIISTNRFFNEDSFELTDEGLTFYKNKGTILLDYFNWFNYEYNVKLFKSINSILEYLLNNGIEVYTVTTLRDNLNFGNRIVTPFNYGFNIKNELGFSPSYYDFLIDKGWKNEEDGHYTNGIQEELAQEYMTRISNIKRNLI